MFTKPFQHIILCSLISFTPVTAFATQTNDTAEKPKVSKTISYKANSELNDKNKKKMLEEASKDISSYSVQKALAPKSPTAARNASLDYSLYDATTDLVSDFDADGFYHRFSVTLDVDTVFDHATVYADFYLSYEGGPWIYYASSDNYDINADNSVDAFTVETELADGYPTGYYDMKIKIYDADTNDYLLTYDYLDDSSLTAIPLEDSYRDDDYAYSNYDGEVIITHGAGSINLLSLLALCLLLATRQVKIIFCSK